MRSGDLKLIVGPEPGAGWFGVFTPNTTQPNFCGKEGGCVACAERPCLFNITADPGEHVDLHDSRPADVARLMTRFKEIEKLYHPEVVAPDALPTKWCDMIATFDGFVGTPWV